MKKIAISLMIVILSISVIMCTSSAGFDADMATKSVLKLLVYENANDKKDQFFATGSGFVAFNSSKTEP